MDEKEVTAHQHPPKRKIAVWRLSDDLKVAKDHSAKQAQRLQPEPGCTMRGGHCPGPCDQGCVTTRPEGPSKGWSDHPILTSLST